MRQLHNLCSAVINGQRAQKNFISTSYNSFYVKILKILALEGLIYGFCIKGKTQKSLIIKLKYQVSGKGLIKTFHCISKPGRRQTSVKAKKLFANVSKMTNMRKGHPKKVLRRGEINSVWLISTREGILTGREAYKRNLGGNLLCLIQ